MALAQKQFDSILLHEGRSADLAGDTGRFTYAGISSANHPNWPGWIQLERAKEEGLDIDSDEVFEGLLTYIRDFYDEYVADLKIMLSSPNVFKAIMDSGITGGPNASVYVQQAVCEQADIDPKGLDGKTGPGFRAAIAELNERLNENGELIGDTLPLHVAIAQMRRYLFVADNKAKGASQELRSQVFGHIRSWMRRTLYLFDNR